MCGAHPIKLLVTWLVADRAINGKSQKKIEKQSVLRKTQPTWVFCFFNPFFGLSEKKQVFVLKKHKNPILHCFIASYNITISELHNNNLLYQLWHLNLRVKNVPHVCFRKCCWSNHSKGVRLDKHAHSKQRKPLPQNSAVLRQVYVHALVVQHLYSQWWDSNFLNEQVLSL